MLAPGLVSSPPIDAHPSHCPTCACDPASASAVARTLQIPPFKIEKYSWLYCLATPASAHRQIIEYFRRHRPIGMKPKAATTVRRIIEVPATSLMVEHQLVPGDYMPVVVHTPAAAPTVHRRPPRLPE